MAPGTFSYSPNGVGPRRHEDVLPRLQGRRLLDDVRRHSVQRHERPDASLLGVLPEPVHRRHGVRPQPGIGRVDRTVDLRRLDRTCCRALSTQRPARGRDGLVRVVQHAALSTASSIPARSAARQSHLLVERHQMKSDGYQTFNVQQRDAFSAKYQFAMSPTTSLTAFTGVIDCTSATRRTRRAPTRAQVAQFGDNYLMSGDPADAELLRLQLLPRADGLRVRRPHAPTSATAGSIDDKVYTLRYYNKQNFNSTTTIIATSAHRQAEQLPQGTATSCRSRRRRDSACSARACGPSTR